MKKVCVLIPSYNEARTIGGIIRGLKEHGLPAYVIDDGSTDDTSAISESEGAIVIKHRKNMGKGASLIEGFKHIIEKDYEGVLVMDGDGQHRIEEIDNFLRQMDKSSADIVIGNRMLDTRNMPYIRMRTNRFMSWLISRISGQVIPDSQCGFRLIKREVLEKIRLSSKRYDVESEIIIKAARAGYKIDSVRIKTVYQDERSKVNPILDTIRFIVFLVRIGLTK